MWNNLINAVEAPFVFVINVVEHFVDHVASLLKAWLAEGRTLITKVVAVFKKAV